MTEWVWVGHSQMDPGTKKSSLYRLGHQSATFGNATAVTESVWSKVSDCRAGSTLSTKADPPPPRLSALEVMCIMLSKCSVLLSTTWYSNLPYERGALCRE